MHLSRNKSASKITILILAGLLLTASPFFFSSGLAQGYETPAVISGMEKGPPLASSTGPGEPLEEGIFLVKFAPSMTGQLDDHGIMLRETSIAKTGITEIDNLNHEFAVTQCRPLLEELYNLSPQSVRFQDRHRAAGLHLWYEMQTDKNQDPLEAARAYSKLEQVEVAEPLYQIELIAPVDERPESSPNGYLNPSGATPPWYPNDPFFINQWHFHNTGQHDGTAGADIDLARAWGLERGQPEVIVAVIDTGVQFDHPDLTGNMWPAIGPEGTGTKPNNHGTHVAGTIAAVTDNSIGVAGIAGGGDGAEGVKIMSIDIFNGPLSRMATFVYAADNGAAIAQNSWGYTKCCTYEQSVLDGIDYFNEYGGSAVLDGGLTIFAAGNRNDGGKWYPAYYEGTMAVAATNNRDQKAWYSNFGSWVELCAPGGETANFSARGVYSTIAGSGYAYYQGTSMACPHLSGVAALMISIAPGELTSDQVKTLLHDTADNHYDANHGLQSRLGSGRVNAYRALLEVQSELSPHPNPRNFRAAAAAEDSIDLSWTKNSYGHGVMIAWSDNNVFGTPSDGTIYAEGQDIPGGGKIIYRGDGSSASHEGLSGGNKYFYRAFSYDAGNTYSPGITTEVTTHPAPISSFPWTETFEDCSATRAHWTQHEISGYKLWSYASGAGGGTINEARSGAKNARFTSNSGGPYLTQLITPTLDLTVLDKPALTFWYGQEDWQDDQNALRLYYRSRPDTDWKLIFEDYSEQSSWRRVTLPLPEPSTTYQLAFEGTDNWGRANVIDDVVIKEHHDSIAFYDRRDGRVYIKYSHAPGPADTTYRLGPRGNNWLAFTADFNSDGKDTFGFYDRSTGRVYVKNDHAPGPADVTYRLGPRGNDWEVLVGDYNGDGSNTFGFYNRREGRVYLKQDHTPGPADKTYRLGTRGNDWLVFTADFNGDGTDTFAFYDRTEGRVYVKNDHTPGPADKTYRLGPRGNDWEVLVGDYNGDGSNTFGFYSRSEGRVYLKNDHTPGPADKTYRLGPRGNNWEVLAGAYTANRMETFAFYDRNEGRVFIKYDHSPGPADITYRLGPKGNDWLVFSGSW